MITYKKLSTVQEAQIAGAVTMMLHASRDCMRNQGDRNLDPAKVPWNICDGYYGEAFGIMRALEVLGYGTLSGPDNIPNSVYPYWNLKYWIHQLGAAVLAEEGFGTTGHCDHCLERYGKDGVRSR